MFRRKPQSQLFVRLMNCEGSVLLECSCNRLPLKEKVILEKSVEFFNDPEPCFIHLSAVTARLLSEISEHIDNKLNQGMELLKGTEDLYLLKSYVNVEGISAVFSYYSVPDKK